MKTRRPARQANPPRPAPRPGRGRPRFLHGPPRRRDQSPRTHRGPRRLDDEILLEGAKAVLDKLQARKRAAENRIELKRTGLRPAEMEVEKWRAETGVRNPPRTDRNTGNCRPETGARQPNPREYRGFSHTGKLYPGDPTPWLTSQSAANQSARKIPC
jgi:hypothetical protein